MSIEGIVEKYDYFRVKLFTSGVKKDPYDEGLEWQQLFIKEMEKVFHNLTPEERQELFKSILDRAKIDLEDLIAECHVLETLECMAVVQIFSQLVGE